LLDPDSREGTDGVAPQERRRKKPSWEGLNQASVPLAEREGNSRGTLYLLLGGRWSRVRKNGYRHRRRQRPSAKLGGEGRGENPFPFLGGLRPPCILVRKKGLEWKSHSRANSLMEKKCVTSSSRCVGGGRNHKQRGNGCVLFQGKKTRFVAGLDEGARWP